MEEHKKQNKRVIKQNKTINKNNSKFTPIDAKEYRSLKIMFHKTLPNYFFVRTKRLLLSYAYNGSGFIGINHKLRDNLNNKYDMIDINHAYQYALVNYEYPLSSKHTIIDNINLTYEEFTKKYKNKHFVAKVNIYNVKTKYNEFDYNIFTNNLLIHFDNSAKMFYDGWLCDIDLISFRKLYNCDIYISYAMIFEEWGELGCKDFIYSKVAELDKLKGNEELYKNYKVALHIATYGKNAQRVDSDGTRSEYIPIAIYQTAYTRAYMIDIYTKYYKYIAYVDSDSFMILHNSKLINKLDIGSGLGQFKIEYENKKIYIGRIKGYFVFADNGDLIKQRWSGIKTILTKRQINNIINCKDFYVEEERVVKGKKVKQKILVRNNEDKGYKLKI